MTEDSSFVGLILFYFLMVCFFLVAIHHFISPYTCGVSLDGTKRYIKLTGDLAMNIPQDAYEPIDDAKGKVWINDKQFFDNVPLVAWEFYNGGYQPAQKWLKDRKGRELTFEDILHYQKIIMALAETNRLMREIDKGGVVIKHKEPELKT